MSSAPPAASHPARPLVPNGMLAMAIFIATEAMFFAALISAFLVLRAQAPEWPPFDQPRLPVGVTGLNTAVLLASGWTIFRALAALRSGGRSFPRWVAATAILGVVFLGIQGFEWVRLIRFGLTTSSSLYGAIFYALVGAHGLHVLVAVVSLVLLLRGALRGRYDAGDVERVEPYRMYWTFVVTVWPVLYVLVYLL